MSTDRTDRRLGKAIFILGCLGIGIAGYLTYVKYAHLEPLCLSSGGCETVQSSRYATFAGMPVPVMGLVGYVLILLSLLVPGDIGRGLTALLAVSGFGFSAYLTWLELARIKAICQWCVASAIVMTALAVLSSIRLWRYQPYAAVPLEDDEPDQPEPPADVDEQTAGV
ncbi:MAG: vitamin K epoxide reductase family protein [Actinobacteria bacterium]|nr:vitamin K epoxide reductase family protein [Actinomycetota bacterium]